MVRGTTENHLNGDAVLKSKLLVLAAALAIVAVFALEFVAIKSGDGQHTKCALTPMAGAAGAYSVSCNSVRP